MFDAEFTHASVSMNECILTAQSWDEQRKFCDNEHPLAMYSAPPQCSWPYLLVSSHTWTRSPTPRARSCFHRRVDNTSGYVLLVSATSLGEYMKQGGGFATQGVTDD